MSPLELFDYGLVVHAIFLHDMIRFEVTLNIA